MSAGAICNREVVVAAANEPVRDAIARMREYHVGTVVAVEEPDGMCVPVGILTDRDITLASADRHVDLEKLCVGDLMSVDLAVAKESDDVLDVVELMKERGVRRVPIVNARGGLVGILSVDDVLEVFAAQLSDLAHIIGRERRHESQKIRS